MKITVFAPQGFDQANELAENQVPSGMRLEFLKSVGVEGVNVYVFECVPCDTPSNEQTIVFDGHYQGKSDLNGEVVSFWI